MFKIQLYNYSFIHFIFGLRYFFGTRYFFDNALAADAQRPSGLAQAGGTIQFMRATNVHVPTAFSAALHPRLRQTASYLLAFCLSVKPVETTNFYI